MRFDWFLHITETVPVWDKPRGLTITITVRCRYNAAKSHPNHHERHSIARLRGRDMECLLWIYPLMHVLDQLLLYHMQKHIMLDRVITTLDCIQLTLQIRRIATFTCSRPMSKHMFFAHVALQVISVNDTLCLVFIIQCNISMALISFLYIILWAYCIEVSIYTPKELNCKLGQNVQQLSA